MKRIWTIFLLVGTVRAADVTLWMTGHRVVDNFVLCAATDQAVRMFDAIGVSLEWAPTRPALGQGVAIEIRFSMEAIRGQPEVLARSTPFDPKPVVTILYSRIASYMEPNRGLRAKLLAHVLVHEIGHVLMKSTSHSADGIMKARWTQTDYGRMAFRPLPFMPDDEDSIRQGLAAFPLRGASERR